MNSMILAIALVLAGSGEQVYMSYDSVELSVVLKDIGDHCGINIVVDPEVHGKINFISPGPIDSSKVYGVFEEMIDSLGFAAVEFDDVNVVRVMTKEAASQYDKSILIELQHASPEFVGPQIQQIISERTMASRAGRIAEVSFGHGARLMVTSDGRLLARGNKRDLSKIQALVAQLDVCRDDRKDKVHVISLQNSNAKDLSDALQPVIGNLIADRQQPVSVVPEILTNSLIVIAPSQIFEILEKTIRELDRVRKQILVSFTLLEVGEEAFDEIGVDWATMDGSVPGSTRGFAFTNLGPRNSLLDNSLEGLALGLLRGSEVGAVLKLLKKNTSVDVLSNPSILTEDHRKAEIVVADNRPIAISSKITESFDPRNPTAIKNFDYKDIGITLQVTPHISGDLIRLEVRVEFSKVVEAASTSFDMPVTSSRRAETLTSVADGGTIVIGGMIGDSEVKSEKKVPLLGDLPLLGGLFRNTVTSKQKSELVLFITPQIVENRDSASEKEKNDVPINQPEKEALSKSETKSFEERRRINLTPEVSITASSIEYRGELIQIIEQKEGKVELVVFLQGKIAVQVSLEECYVEIFRNAPGFYITDFSKLLMSNQMIRNPLTKETYSLYRSNQISLVKSPKTLGFFYGILKVFQTTIVL